MDHSVFPVTEAAKANTHMTATQYEAACKLAKDNPEAFWRQVGERLEWMQPFTKVKDVNYDRDDFRIRWYEDGILNVSANCLDRHLDRLGNTPALIWQGDALDETKTFTFRQLHQQVCRCANVLKAQGVQKGDRVILYMPMIPEAVMMMQACARIGAVHSVVFGGFSPESLAGRIQDCGAQVVITANEGLRGGKLVPLKTNVDAALSNCPNVRSVVVVERTAGGVPMTAGRDVWLHEALGEVDDDCPPEPMGAEDPLFILYTSGSTGKPKGVLHTTGGYLAWASYTHELVFDCRPGQDVFWCTADVGWVTGHTYLTYGPLANGITSLMFEGVPTAPDPGRFWREIDHHKVTVFYTAPTAIRALMREGEEWLEPYDLSSLRLLGTVGEPINPEAWLWYHRYVGHGRLPIVDTWWQTETGGALLSPLPGATPLKPGAATKPLPGISPILVDTEGRELTGATEGNLCLADSWPGQMRTVYGDHQRFIETYFTTYPGRYFTGDGARRDADGDFWITGRVDDVLNVSGHRLGTTEVESALVEHHDVAEAAVVGFPHDIKGQGIYCYVTLNAGLEGSDDLRQALVALVRQEIGPTATPDVIQFTPSLPKTRSGKIMRRILRKIAAREEDQLGDISTLAEPGVVKEILANRRF